MPWEIFRTGKILPHTSRPITFFTKSGSVLPGYSSYIILLPEYDVGITILTAGSDSTLKEAILEAITKPLVTALEQISQTEIAQKYTGTYTFLSSTLTDAEESLDLNTTLIVSHTPEKSLHITSFISNGTDVFETWSPMIDYLIGHNSKEGGWRAQLIPTLLYRDQENQKGELWRIKIVPERYRAQDVWDEFCITDIDTWFFGGKPIFELAFWDGDGDGDEQGGKVAELDLTAFRVRLGREKGPLWVGGFDGDEQQQIVMEVI